MQTTTIFIKMHENVRVEEATLGLYEKASSAKVNWGKRDTLLIGPWEEKAVARLPGNLQWGKRGIKFLGVFLGTKEFQKQNWEDVEEKVCAKLSKWKWMLPQLSYKERVLVASNLVAATLWHRFLVLQPRGGWQRVLVDYCGLFLVWTTLDMSRCLVLAC